MTNIDTPIDDDYIDVETRRADISESEEAFEDDTIVRDSRAHQNADTSHRFDMEQGAGAAEEIDELIDQNAIIEHDGRAKTRTFYYVDEAPPERRRRMARMLRWQEGEGAGNQTRVNEADRNRWIDGFCGQLEMSSHQVERTRLIVNDVDMQKMSRYSSEKIILAAASIVANEDNRWIRDEAMFSQLLDDIDSDPEEIKTLRKMLRRYSEHV